MRKLTGTGYVTLANIEPITRNLPTWVFSCVAEVEVAATIVTNTDGSILGFVHFCDLVLEDILNIKTNEEGILCLGDSEDDNQAFRKASAALGIISEKRLTPMLDSQYLIELKTIPALMFCFLYCSESSCP